MEQLDSGCRDCEPLNVVNCKATMWVIRMFESYFAVRNATLGEPRIRRRNRLSISLSWLLSTRQMGKPLPRKEQVVRWRPIQKGPSAFAGEWMHRDEL